MRTPCRRVARTFPGGLRAALVDELVQVDRDERWRGPDADFAPVVRVQLDHVGRNDVLPAVILEGVVGTARLRDACRFLHDRSTLISPIQYATLLAKARAR